MVVERGSKLLVDVQHFEQTARIPPGVWEPWSYLMSEAIHYGWVRQRERLKLFLQVSCSVDGWLVDRLVDALHGEEVPKPQPVGASIQGGKNGAAVAPGMAVPMLAFQAVEPPKKKGLVGRLGLRR